MRKSLRFSPAANGLCAAGLMFAIIFGGCSARNIHTDITSDPRIMVRQWTVGTHGQFEAGEKGFEASAPILTDDTLVFGTQNRGVVALYPERGQTRWVLPIDSGVVSEILVDRDKIYFVGGDGYLYAASLEYGRVSWRYDLHNPIASKPTISGGRLFVTTSDDIVYAFDAATGKWLWHYRRRSNPTATILGASAPLVDGQDVLVGLSDGYLVCLSVQDGNVKWEKRLHQGRKFTDVDAQPVLERGLIYVPSYDGALYALKRENGDTVWRFDSGGSRQITLEGERLYLPASDGYVYALQKNNGKVIWKFELDLGVPTPVVPTDKHLIVGSSGQYLYLLDKESGRGIYRYNAGHGQGFNTRPVFDFSTSKVYALSGTGNLYAFQMRAPDRKKRKLGGTDGYVWDPYTLY